MKLSNFLRLDPSYKGKGLEAGSKLDKEVWDEFSDDTKHLRAIAQAILDNMDSKMVEIKKEAATVSDEDEFPEGRVLTRVHRLRERNASLVRKKKQTALKKNGCLACEVCDFDFSKVYGSIGEGFIECHHTVPLSELKKTTKTRLRDLALVCANCHRMLHRTRPWISVHGLREKLLLKLHLGI
jgi:5-methylcytosine-specific restriction protein A